MIQKKIKRRLKKLKKFAGLVSPVGFFVNDNRKKLKLKNTVKFVSISREVLKAVRK